MGEDALNSPPTHTQERVPCPLPWPRFPLQAKGLSASPHAWVQRRAWLGSSLEVKNYSHSNCTLETRQGEKINEEKLDRKKKRESERLIERDDIKLLTEAGQRGGTPPTTPMHFESCLSSPQIRENCPPYQVPKVGLPIRAVS